MGGKKIDGVSGTWKQSAPLNTDDAYAEGLLNEDPACMTTYHDNVENQGIVDELDDDGVEPLDFEKLSFESRDFTPDW